KARGTSWIAHPTVETRSGLDSMTVSPSACSTVMGHWDSSAGTLDSASDPVQSADSAAAVEAAVEASEPLLSEQAVSASAAMADTAVRRTSLDVCTMWSSA